MITRSLGRRRPAPYLRSGWAAWGMSGAYGPADETESIATIRATCGRGHHAAGYR